MLRRDFLFTVGTLPFAGVQISENEISKKECFLNYKSGDYLYISEKESLLDYI